MRSILITGASGFIGGRAAERLSARGYHVVTCGRGASRPRTLVSSEIEYRRADFSNVNGIRKILDDVDAVLHCAGKAGAWGTYQDYYDSNVVLTERLLAAAGQSGVRRFINISSPSIYFDYKNLFRLTEDYLPRRFSNAYAETKYLAERAVRAAHRQDFETISLRPRGVIGAGDTNWLPRIIEMRKAGALKQVGRGTNIVNFTSVSNLLDAIELTLSASGHSMGETYNIHNGSDESFWEVVEKALSAAGLDARRRRVPLLFALGAARLNEKWHRWRGSKNEPELLPIKVGVSAYSLTMDISKARRKLGYQPKQTTDEALAEFARWYALRV